METESGGDTEPELTHPEIEPNSMPDPDGQEYLDRSKLDFDPVDGHYTGTAVDGTTEIPGPHAFEHDNDAGEEDDGVPSEQGPSEQRPSEQD
ncbi:MAG: hypothetical protein M3N95_17275 [Actinomycetota bacterium]|nr:hypothetical protein [Actinomycetota bacterium]